VRSPHVVIIGGGFGGLAAAKALAGTAARVTLVDRHNYHLFQPLLYQVATATLSAGDIGAPIRWVLRKADNVRVLLGDVQSIDVAGRRVVVADAAPLLYDYLIVATGGRHSYFAHPEWEAFAPGLKTLDDALLMRRRILLAFERAEKEEDAARRSELLTFVLVGGGPTGVELAGTLAEITRQTLRDEFKAIDTARARIVVVEAGPSILSTFREDLRDAARRSLRRLGVEVRENTIVVGIDAHGVDLRAGGVTERIAASTVLWAAGVAASPVLKTLGVPLDRAGRVIVEPDLSIPGQPEVFVIGDAATFHHTKDGTPLPGVVQPATQGAAHAARMILRRERGEPSTTFVYKDLGNMAIVGRASAIADLGWIHLSGLVGWLAWLFLHIAKLIGFRNRIVVLLEWAVAYITYQRGARLITGVDSNEPTVVSVPGSKDPGPHT